MRQTCLANDDTDCPWWSCCRHGHNADECLAANADRDSGPKDADSERDEESEGQMPRRYLFPPSSCGTHGGYTHGCRCAKCTQANTEYHRQYQARLKRERLAKEESDA